MDIRVCFFRAHRPACLSAALAVALSVAATSVAAQDLFLPGNEVPFQNYSAEFPVVWTSYSAMRGQVITEHLARLLKAAPSSPETLEMLVYQERHEQFAEALGQLLASDPARIVWPFELAWRRGLFSRVQAGSAAADAMQRLRSDVQGQLGRLARNDAARIERVLIWMDLPGREPQAIQARADRLRAFIARYPGTSAALQAELDVIVSSTSRAADDPRVDQFIRQHPGTEAAATALYGKGQQLARQLDRDVDPTDQLLAVFAIVKELESGRYPASDPVTLAPYLGIEARPGDRAIAQANVDRLLTGYIDFVQQHFQLPELGRAADGIRELVSGPIFALFTQRGNGLTGVEGLLTYLERIDAPRARYIRGAFYIERLTDARPAERDVLLQKARDTLTALSASNSGLHSRRALATLASLNYAESDFAAARTSFTAYASAYPNTAWSWIAAIRIGQCEQLLGRLDAAIAAFRSASERYGSLTLARQVASTFAGRASEQASRFDEARADYERALENWGDLRLSVRMESYVFPNTPPAWPLVDITGIALQERLTQLRTSANVSEGVFLERGRAMMDGNRREDAILAFEQFIRTYPQSPLVTEARRLSHQLKLRAALDLADPAGPRHDAAAANAALTTLEREPWDAAIGVTRIARATMVALQAPQEADALMMAALREWQQKQSITPVTSVPSDVAKDVAEIQRQLFEGESPTASWRAAFSWPGGTSRFQVVNPQVMVAVGTALPTPETIYQPSSSGSMLFMTSDQIALLVDALNAVAGQRAAPVFSPFPADLLKFVGTYLPPETAFMGGGLRSFGSVPKVTLVRFTNTERTRAEVTFDASLSGGIAVMEKTGSTWRVTSAKMTYIV